MNDGTSGNTLLCIRLDEQQIAQFEWIEAGKTYREWLIPAEVANKFESAEIVAEEEPRALSIRLPA